MITKTHQSRRKGRSSVVFRRKQRELFFLWFALLLTTEKSGARVCKISKECPFPSAIVQEELREVFRTGWTFIPAFDETKKIVRIQRRPRYTGK
jgi:hypothetical protein